MAIHTTWSAATIALTGLVYHILFLGLCYCKGGWILRDDVGIKMEKEIPNMQSSRNRLSGQRRHQHVDHVWSRGSLITVSPFLNYSELTREDARRRSCFNLSFYACSAWFSFAIVAFIYHFGPTTVEWRWLLRLRHRPLRRGSCIIHAEAYPNLTEKCLQIEKLEGQLIREHRILEGAESFLEKTSDIVCFDTVTATLCVWISYLDVPGAFEKKIRARNGYGTHNDRQHHTAFRDMYVAIFSDLIAAEWVPLSLDSSMRDRQQAEIAAAQERKEVEAVAKNQIAQGSVSKKNRKPVEDYSK